MARLNLIVGDAQARLVVREEYSTLALAGNFSGENGSALLERVMNLLNGFQGRIQVSLAGCRQWDPGFFEFLVAKKHRLEDKGRSWVWEDIPVRLESLLDTLFGD